MTRVFIIAIACCLAAAAVHTQDAAGGKLDYAMLAKIRDEGLNRSQALDHVSWLADVYGPRLQGSPAIRQAGEWVQKTLRSWNVANVHDEKWPFGKGWALRRFSANMTEPQAQPLIGVPRSWTPGTPGPITAEVVRVDIHSDADFDEVPRQARRQDCPHAAVARGPDARGHRRPALERRPPQGSDDDAHSGAAGAGARGRGRPAGGLRRQGSAVLPRRACRGELRSRRATPYIVPGDNQMSWRTQRTDGGTIFPSAAGPHDSAKAGKVVPSVTLAVEHYNRMVRDPRQGHSGESRPRYSGGVLRRDRAERLQHPSAICPAPIHRANSSCSARTSTASAPARGATDNAAGVAVMMEAMRILKAVGAKPRRTIRIGLWGGEEEGLLGSKAYVQAHLADPKSMALKPEHQKISAYYNLDNGTGRIHGVWMQGNLAVIPIFEEWIKPLGDFEVTTLTPQSVRGSDYLSFDDVGIPAFQFMQDRVEYNSRTHHSNMDVVDRVQRDDLVQMAVVVATIRVRHGDAR